MEETVPSVSSGPNTGATTRRPAPPQHHQQAPQHHDDDGRDAPRRRTQRSMQSMLTILSSPIAILSKMIAVIALLVRVALAPFQNVAQYLFPVNELDGLHSESGRRAARAFNHFFATEYGLIPSMASPASRSSSVTSRSSSTEQEQELDPKCPFVEHGYQETITNILEQSQRHERDLAPTPPLLFLYLHAPLHPSSQKFCTDTLATQPTLDLLSTLSTEGHVSCWAGSLHSAEGNHVASLMQVTQFPFIALVKPSTRTSSSSTTPPHTSLEVYFRMEGPNLTRTSAASFQSYLQTALGSYQIQSSQAVQSRLQRQEEVQLRQEQDAEYEAALEADRRRDAERAAEAERMAAEEAAVREAKEASVREKEMKLSRARGMLEERGEPRPGQDACKVRFVLPTGQKILRNFHPEDTVGVMRAFLILHFSQLENQNAISNFGLCMNYPKKNLVQEDVTLRSEGLSPQAVIMVQDLDA